MLFDLRAVRFRLIIDEVCVFYSSRDEYLDKNLSSALTNVFFFSHFSRFLQKNFLVLCRVRAPVLRYTCASQSIVVINNSERNFRSRVNMSNFSSKQKKKRPRLTTALVRLAFFSCFVWFVLDALDFFSSSSSSSSVSPNNQHRREVFHRRGASDVRGNSFCDGNEEKEILLDNFRRAWLDATKDYGSGDTTAKIIQNFKGPLTLHAKLGPKLPKVPKANGEMEDLGLISKSDLRNLPERDALDELNERGFKSCAVVGNGGSLLLYEHGDIIDAHDAVFRFNDGTGKEPYSKYAGSRTTVRLVNSQHRGYRESDEEIVLQHLTAPAHLKLYVSNRAKKLVNAKDYALSGAFYSFVKNRIDKKSTPTNGMYGLYLAQSVCEKITIFGFARQWYNVTRYHYHNDYEPTGSQNARDSAEMIPLEKLVRDKPTKVMFGEPCVGGGGSTGGSNSNNNRCLLCPKGSRCDDASWVPVPEVGFKALPKEKVCLYPARSVEGPARYGTVDAHERCYEQPKVDCFLRS